MLGDVNALLALAVILVAGLLGGQIAHRIRLPHITGQILIGVLIGHSGFNLLTTSTVGGLEIMTEFALGLIALMVGEQLNIRTLRNAGRRLFLLLATEAIITPAIVFVAIYPIVHTPWLPLLLGALAVSTAPATIIALIKETRSRGVFVKTLSAAVALNNIACLAIFAIVRTVDHLGLVEGARPPLAEALLVPFLQIAASVALGLAVGTVLVVVTRREVRSDRLAGASIIALLLVSGISLFFELSLLLSCLFLGVAVANFSPSKREIGGSAFANLESVIFAAFFTLAGMELELSNLLTAGLVALVVVVARFGGKLVSAWLAMRLAGATANVRRYLGLALVPQAGVAVGLILLVQQDPVLLPLHTQMLTIGLTAVMVNELIGSVTAHIALRRSGEAGKDRPRLIDFIHEQHIVTDLEASTKEEAIGRLMDVMITTHRLRVDRDEFLHTFLQREAEASTCVGSGLAIPHGTLHEGSQMIGVMGISREGLQIETPDGMPVHCMVLLATPESERERHLEVIAALARAVGRDPNIQSQLFSAKSPAHAYEILHGEEAEDFNYYLADSTA